MTQSQSKKENVAPGASWKDNEEHVLPKDRFKGIVIFGLTCTRFLAGLDTTITATALPTIVAELGGGNNYNWVGSAYMLAAAAFSPLYGKLSNMFGRKPVLFFCIFIFLFGSAMCGAAQNMTWLIICRAVQGIGGGGLIQLTIIIIMDIFSLKDQGRYVGVFSAVLSVSSIVGPILGGALSEHASWRWCFFINLPIGGIAALCFFILPNLNLHQRRPIRGQVAELDFVGLVTLMGGVECFLVGLGFGQNDWSDAKTVVLLVVGIVLLVAGGINETFTKRSAFLPARLFKTRTTGFILVSTFFHGLIFFGTSYYLPLFFQVLGASPTGAGIKMLTFLLGIPVSSTISGFILSKTGKYRPIIWASNALMTLGMGLMIMLNYQSGLVVQELLPLIAALGLGPPFQVLLVGLQAAMPLKDMATTSSAYLLLRIVGGAVGISVGEAIIASVLPLKLAHIPNFASLGLDATAADLLDSIGEIHEIPDAALRDSILEAWSQAFSAIWILFTAMAGCMLILTLFLREYSLERKTVRNGEFKTLGDAEKCGQPEGQAKESVTNRKESE